MPEMDDRDDSLAFLDEFAHQAAERVGVPTECSILLRQHDRLQYVASSGERAAECDRVEVEHAEGPCVVALQQLRGELVLDVAADVRWPAWRDAAIERGFASAAALPALVDAETRLALNLYADVVDPWDRETLVAMDRFAQEIAEAVRTRGLVLPGEPERRS